MAQAKRSPRKPAAAKGGKTGKAEAAEKAAAKPKRAARAPKAAEAPEATLTGPEAAPPLYRAQVSKVRISPRKVRLVVDLIRGKPVPQAMGILDHVNKRSAPIVKTLLKSAVANAEQQDQQLDVDALRVREAYVDMGQTLKRFRARAMGRASAIRKRSSRITLAVG